MAGVAGKRNQSVAFLDADPRSSASATSAGQISTPMRSNAPSGWSHSIAGTLLCWFGRRLKLAKTNNCLWVISLVAFLTEVLQDVAEDQTNFRFDWVLVGRNDQ